MIETDGPVAGYHDAELPDDSERQEMFRRKVRQNDALRAHTPGHGFSWSRRAPGDEQALADWVEDHEDEVPPAVMRLVRRTGQALFDPPLLAYAPAWDSWISTPIGPGLLPGAVERQRAAHRGMRNLVMPHAGIDVGQSERTFALEDEDEER